MSPGEGLGLLLSLPMDSIAVRTILASVAAVVLGRVLLQHGFVRVPRLRALVALLPGLALVGVLVGFVTSPALPGLWLPVDAAGDVSVRVADTYLSFEPVAAGALLAVWATVVAARVGLRTRRTLAVRRAADATLDRLRPPPVSLVALVHRVARSMDVVAPQVVVLPELRGGAMVLGVRQPLLAVDARLLDRLDEHEVEGVVAHELAHVARHDNLVAAALGVVRDAFFFVPGGAWSLTRLLREREHAADSAAVAVTGRPGALASGLLKVLDGAATAPACAPLMPEGTLVERVRMLCDDHPTPTRGRVAGELVVTAAATGIAVLAAVTVPGMLAGEAGQRDALGVLLSGVGEPAAAAGSGAAAFRVFRELGAPAAAARDSAAVDRPDLDDPALWTPEQLDACAGAPADCSGDDAVGPSALPLRPPTVLSVADDRVAHWRLDPVFAPGDRELALFWFQRVQ